MRVAIEERDLDLCHVYVSVNVGSMDEVPGQRGIAHFLEHCIFSGTKNWPEEKDVWETIESTGGKINAYTTKDHTSVFCAVLPQYLERALTLIGEMLFVPRLEQQNLDQEKEIIRAEILKAQNGLEVKANRFLLEALAKDNPVSGDVLGSIEEMQKLTRTDLRAFHRKFYVPKNAAIAIVGPKIDKIEKVIERSFAYAEGELPSFDRKDIEKKGPISQEKVVKGTQGAVALGFPTPNIHEASFVPALVHALGNMSTFGLRSIIRFQEGLAYTVNAVWNDYSHASHGIVYARCGTKDVDKIAGEMLRFCEILQTKLLNRKTFMRVKNSFLGKQIENKENPELRAKKLVHLLLNKGEQKENELTPEGLQQAAELLENYAIIKVRTQ